MMVENRVDIAAERTPAPRPARDRRVSPDDATPAPASLPDPSDRRHSTHDLRAYAITPTERPDAPPVQMKLIKAGKMMEAVDNESAISRQLRESDEEFTLRDDSGQTDEAVHVLERKAYLLGEEHGSGEWRRRTEKWSVATMHEKKKDAGAAGSSGPVNAGKEEAKLRPAFPLESIHAYAVQEVVTLKFQANMMQRFFNEAVKKYNEVEGNRRSNAEDRVGIIKILELAQSTAGHMLNGLYALESAIEKIENYVKTIENSQDLEMFSEEISLKRLIDNKLIVRQAIDHAESLIEKPLPTPVSVMAAGPARISQVRSLCDELTVLALPGLAARFAEAAKATDQEKEGVDAMMGSNRPTRAEGVSGASGLRETAMAARIRRGPRPLLVQLGDDHVAPLAATLGADAKAVPIETKFEDLTKRPAPG